MEMPWWMLVLAVAFLAAAVLDFIGILPRF